MFCPGLGTFDQLYTLTRVLERAWEFSQPAHICFVYLEKAFDCVPGGVLWGGTLGVYGTGPVVTGY